MRKPYLVGITGGSASGKTTFLNKLLGSFDPEDICLISQDNYYIPQPQLSKAENVLFNFDEPAAFDVNNYAADILKLSQGQSFTRPEYTFNNPEIVPRTFSYHPAPIILIEGIFTFYFEEVAKLLDLKIYIDAKEHVKMHRRIIRDKVERGYELDDVLHKYLNHVVPAYEKYIAPYKHDADVIIPNNLHFDRGLEMVVTFLNSKIETN